MSCAALESSAISSNSSTIRSSSRTSSQSESSRWLSSSSRASAVGLSSRSTSSRMSSRRSASVTVSSRSIRRMSECLSACELDAFELLEGRHQESERVVLVRPRAGIARPQVLVHLDVRTRLEFRQLNLPDRRGAGHEPADDALAVADHHLGEAMLSL